MRIRKKTVKDFSKKQIQNIAYEYANSSWFYIFFCEEYNISQNVFYSLLKKAIVENICDMETAIKIKNKTMNNAEFFTGFHARIKSQRYYDTLLQKRKTFLPSINTIKETTIAFANSGFDKKVFAARNYVTISLLNRIIIKAVTDNLLKKDDLLKLKEKCFREKDELQGLWKNKSENS